MIDDLGKRHFCGIMGADMMQNENNCKEKGCSLLFCRKGNGQQLEIVVGFFFLFTLGEIRACLYMMRMFF